MSQQQPVSNQPTADPTNQPATQSVQTQPVASTRLTVPDLISIGIFTALYFVCVCVATLISTLVAGAGTIFLPALSLIHI